MKKILNSIFRKSEDELLESGTVTRLYDAFKPGEQFPPEHSVERIAKYRRMKKLYEGKQEEIYERATLLLQGTPHEKYLRQLYIAVNIADIIVTKPADLLVGEAPLFESGKGPNTPQQEAIDSYVEENDLVKMIHESTIGNGHRGDSWMKVRWDYRQDFSALLQAGFDLPDNLEMEALIEHVAADCVFPVTSNGNVKKFKEIVIAAVEWVVSEKKDVPFLNVERHLPGIILHERYRLQTFEGGVNTQYGYPVDLFKIVEKIGETAVTETKVPHFLVHHLPHKTSDDAWQGKGTLESLESILVAINDRLAQIDYVLWKHTDPIMYGPSLDNTPTVSAGGRYIEVTKESGTPGYMTWDSKLEGAFKELETLLALAFQIAETPQWLFGTVLGSDNAGGTGTSHTDGAAIRARFMPILSKVNRIRTHMDRGIRDVLYTCQLLDIAHGEKKFEAVYPLLTWRDSLPRNEKELAEIMEIRTGAKPTLDVATAVKRMDGLDDAQAAVIVRAIEAESAREATVDASIFNKDARPQAVATETDETSGGDG